MTKASKWLCTAAKAKGVEPGFVVLGRRKIFEAVHSKGFLMISMQKFLSD